MDNGEIRKFETGATRDTSLNKLDFEAFLSPLVLTSFAEYMHEHRKQSDGGLRPGDNWQKGIPRTEYAKSLLRHVIHFWLIHRGHLAFDENGKEVQMIPTLHAIVFNAWGYLFELLRGR